MKTRSLIFGVGVVVGAILMFTFSTLRSRQTEKLDSDAVAPKIPVEVADEMAELRLSLSNALREVRQLESDNGKLVGKIGELRRTTPVAGSSAATNASHEEAPLAALTKLFGGQDGEGRDTNGMAGAMGKFMKAALQQRIDSRLETLKSKINLTPEQEQSLREIWEKELDAQQGMAMKVLGGKLKEEDASTIEKSTFNARDEIRKTLTAEQWDGFQQFEQEERAGMARLAANSELLQLQQVLPLSPEKQDQVFAVLMKQAEGQFNDTQQPGGVTRAMDWQQQFEAKKEAMRPVLSPEEFKAYEKHLMDNQESGMGSIATQSLILR